MKHRPELYDQGTQRQRRRPATDWQNSGFVRQTGLEAGGRQRCVHDSVRHQAEDIPMSSLNHSSYCKDLAITRT